MKPTRKAKPLLKRPRVEVKEEETFEQILKNAQKVIVIPGYGLAPGPGPGKSKRAA